MIQYQYSNHNHVLLLLDVNLRVVNCQHWLRRYVLQRFWNSLLNDFPKISRLILQNSPTTLKNPHSLHSSSNVFTHYIYILGGIHWCKLKLLWSSGQGSGKDRLLVTEGHWKVFEGHWKALKLYPLPKAYIKFGCYPPTTSTTLHPPVSLISLN